MALNLSLLHSHPFHPIHLHSRVARSPFLNTLPPKNLVLYGLLAIGAIAAPTPAEEASLTPLNGAALETSLSSPLYTGIEKRKNGNKCAAHIHIDCPSLPLNGLCGARCTNKWKADLLINPGNVMGYDWYWAHLGTWGTTNPNYRIKIRTTKGLEPWIDRRPPSGFIRGNWRNGFTLHYESQHWNGHECQNWRYKLPGVSNGHRHEFDLSWVVSGCGTQWRQ